MDNSKKSILEKINSEEFRSEIDKLNIKSTILFGSILTDEFNEESDVDIALVSNEKIELTKILRLELFLENFLNRPIDVVDLNNEQLDVFIKKEIVNTGNIVYSVDNNGYLEKYTDKLDWYFKENEVYFSFRKRELLS